MVRRSGLQEAREIDVLKKAGITGHDLRRQVMVRCCWLVVVDW